MTDDAGDEPASGLFDGVMNMHAILRKIERAGMDPKTNKGGKPIAAALPGTALGIGLEIPLACHRIFAADNPKAKIGLPEIMVGIFPGAGGTTRLVRKLGAMAASPCLLEGKLIDPKKAKPPASSTRSCPQTSCWQPRSMGAVRSRSSSSPGTKRATRCPAARPITPRVS